jgi:hypothetical protein
MAYSMMMNILKSYAIRYVNLPKGTPAEQRGLAETRAAGGGSWKSS